MNICVYGASSTSLDKIYYEEATELGRAIARRGHGLVFGGGCEGVMGATIDGVALENGYSLGIAPKFFIGHNVLSDKCTEFIYTEDMRERKALMSEKSDAFIMAPGGIGTFEEFFEVLTLKQLGRQNKPIAIFNTNNYFAKLQEYMEYIVSEGFLKKECLGIYKLFTDPDELLDYLEEELENKPDLSNLKNI